MNAIGLSHRSRRVLLSVVAEYIASGRPVGSRTLSKSYGLDLSPATIRNVLSDLEETGFLHQPHTSAGRVPTDRGLRVFIEVLTDFDDVSPEHQDRIRTRMGQIFRGDRQKEQVLRETGELLSELSGSAAVVATLRAEDHTLSQLRFISTRPNQLLAVLVFSDGTVENRFIDVEGGVGEGELNRIHNLLGDVVEGRTLKALRDLFARRLDDDRSQVDALRRRAFDLGQRALSGVGSGPQELVIEGQGRLLQMPEYEDAARLKQLVLALEDRTNLLELLDKTMSTGVVTVYIGSETGELGGAQLSLVVAPYGDGEGGAGTVGVLGPTRMNYARVMPLVGRTAEAITAAMRNRDKG